MYIFISVVQDHDHHIHHVDAAVHQHIHQCVVATPDHGQIQDQIIKLTEKEKKQKQKLVFNIHLTLNTHDKEKHINISETTH